MIKCLNDDRIIQKQIIKDFLRRNKLLLRGMMTIYCINNRLYYNTAEIYFRVTKYDFDLDCQICVNTQEKSINVHYLMFNHDHYQYKLT